MHPPFFFDFFAAVDEGWSAIEMTDTRMRQDVRHATYKGKKYYKVIK
jgi:hypothetical protein